MARKTLRRTHRPLGDINLTPLIDTTFLLLVTFIITFPFVQQGIPLNLPAGTAKDLPTERTRTISVDRQGTVFLDDTACPEEKLEAEMKEVGRTAPQTTILVRADEALPYGRVVRILKILHEAKLERMALVTRPDGKAKP